MNFFETTFGEMLLTCLMAMVPVIELRGAIPFGLALGLPYTLSFAASVVGNIIPVPFIIIFIRRIFAWLREKSEFFKKLVGKLEVRAANKAELVYKYALIGLVILVAIPLPGTGAWTGALIAALLGIRLKAAFPAIVLGVLIAGFIVTGISYGFGYFING